ncbi:MAG: EscU/YscU/HrcU family type III secretion system export apparatus switch protein [Betaproteobacteria bacterium]|nr:EscU/YscU/HrcU family type III secretion system export apparatus switch protein [Betaproteobacteria bacterium]
MEERGENQQDKTEEASEERRRQYREEGQLANPREMLAAITLMIVTVGLTFLGSEIFVSLEASFNRALALVAFQSKKNLDFMDMLNQVVAPVAPVMIGTIALLGVVPSMIGLVFTQFNWSWKKITPTPDKLNIVSGLQKMLSVGGFEELVKVLIKGIVLCTVLYVFMKKELEESELYFFFSNGVMAESLFGAILKLLTWVTVTMVILGAADYGWSWFRLERQMMMSKQEVKEENKSQEGDPLVRSQRRRIAREMIMRKNINAVPTATFVVTNPTHFSIAIRYVRGMPAPIVVAKGQDFLAMKIREIAKKNDIMLVENKALARTLYKTVKVGQEVPPSLYASVIEVMKVIYQARGKDYFERFNLQSAVG